MNSPEFTEGMRRLISGLRYQPKGRIQLVNDPYPNEDAVRAHELRLARPGIDQWAARHGVTPLALNELRAMIGVDYGGSNVVAGGSEARVQSLIRLEAPQFGVRLWRNNVGVLPREDGVPIRFGLANDTPALNRQIKSGDLVGWRRVAITAAMTGTTIAQFVSRECKPAAWIPNPNDAHEEAQRRWAMLINADGGDARFVQGEGSFS